MLRFVPLQAHERAGAASRPGNVEHNAAEVLSVAKLRIILAHADVRAQGLQTLLGAFHSTENRTHQAGALRPGVRNRFEGKYSRKQSKNQTRGK